MCRKRANKFFEKKNESPSFTQDIRKDLKILMVKEEIGSYAEKYKERTVTHSNQLATQASKILIEKRRLQREHHTDLTKEIK